MWLKGQVEAASGNTGLARTYWESCITLLACLKQEAHNNTNSFGFNGNALVLTHW